MLSFLFLVALAAPEAPEAAHRRAPDAARVSLDLINDAWATGLDEGFSSRFRLVGRFRPFIGRGLTGVVPARWNVVAEYWSVAAQFDIYTPTNLDGDRVVEVIDDRPYAGYLSGTGGVDLVMRDSPITGAGHHFFSATIEMGLVGPSTGAGAFQRSWHNWLRRTLNRNVTPRDPRGWGIYEIPDAFLIGVRARYEAEAFRKTWSDPSRLARTGAQPGAQMSGFTDCSLGTIRVTCDVGATFRAGLLPEIVGEGVLPISSWAGRRPPKPLQAYLQTGVSMQVALFDAFLDGPVGMESFTAERREVNGTLHIGTVLRFGKFELFYRHMVTTRQIRRIPDLGVKVQQLGQFILSWGWS